jgi:hypothetical protein
VDGKQTWIEARASSLVRVRGMGRAEALEKASQEWDRYRRLDAARNKLDKIRE